MSTNTQHMRTESDQRSTLLDEMVADTQLFGDYDADPEEIKKILDYVRHGKHSHTIIITRGLPASGKSTFAHNWVAENPHNRVEINRDNTRAFIGAPKLGTTEQENTVTDINNTLLDTYIRQGKDIIVSDTNLRVRYIKSILKKVPDTYIVQLKDFIEDVNTCVERDKNRPEDERVGESVIRDLDKRFPAATWKTLEQIYAALQGNVSKYVPYRNSPENPKAILVDIDGTLAHHNNRRDIFDFTAIYKDAVDENVREAVIDAHQAGKTVIVMSGRSDSCRKETAQWLADNGIPYGHLFMRKNGDIRADWIVKDELIREHVHNHYNVVYCLDDRNQVVHHNRDMGYKVFQVAPGNF